jgi:hypothetical protein
VISRRRGEDPRMDAGGDEQDEENALHVQENRKGSPLEGEPNRDC